MALERKDRIKEQTTTTGTGTVSLNGTAPSGFRTFVSAVTSLATVRYLIEFLDQSEWEVGEGVFTDGTPDTLTRVTVYASSNAGSKVDFSIGTKNVSLVFTANDLVTEKADLTKYSNLNLAEGQMINGRILPSVASGNLTVALKTLAGTNPSATDPVYVMIGGVVRSITKALSVIASAGTNFMNLGSAELATKETDLFVYLFVDMTNSSIDMAVCRVPYFNDGGEVTASETSEKGRFATVAPASGDPMVNIGRFATTLSAGDGYTWTVPTFTAINLIQRPIYETRRLNWYLTWDLTTVDDGSGAQPGTPKSYYQIINNRLKLSLSLTSGYKVGAGDAIKMSGALPMAYYVDMNYAGIGTFYSEWNNGELEIAVARLISGLIELRFNNSIADNNTIYGSATCEYWLI